MRRIQNTMYVLSVLLLLLYGADGNQLDILQTRILFLQARHDVDISLLRSEFQRKIEEISQNKCICDPAVQKSEEEQSSSVVEISRLKGLLIEERRMREMLETKLDDLLRMERTDRHRLQEYVYNKTYIYDNAFRNIEETLAMEKNTSLGMSVEGNPILSTHSARLQILERGLRDEKIVRKRASTYINSPLSDLKTDISHTQADVSETRLDLWSEMETSISNIREELFHIHTNLTATRNTLANISQFIVDASEWHAQIGNDMSNIKQKLKASSTTMTTTAITTGDSPTATSEIVTCAEGYTYIRSFSLCYKVHKRGQLFIPGRSQCQSEGSDLIMFASREEMTYIGTLLKTTENLGCCTFVGFKEVEETNRFRWLNGTTLDVQPYTEGGLWEPTGGHDADTTCGCIYDQNYWLEDCCCDCRLPYLCGHHI